MDLDQMLTPFLTWQFVLSAVLINAILAYVRQFLGTANPALLERRWFKAILTVANPILGFCIAFVPSFLYGTRFVERAFVGVCAGFLSNFVYALFIKRLAPPKDAAAPTSQVPKSEAITEELPESEIRKG
jgi:hypothetical protein